MQKHFCYILMYLTVCALMYLLLMLLCLRSEYCRAAGWKSVCSICSEAIWDVHWLCSSQFAGCRCAADAGTRLWAFGCFTSWLMVCHKMSCDLVFIWFCFCQNIHVRFTDCHIILCWFAAFRKLHYYAVWVISVLKVGLHQIR